MRKRIWSAHRAAVFFGDGLAIAVAALSASAQGPACGPREVVLNALQQRHGEKRIAAAVTAAGELIEVLAGRSGTWTILVTAPKGPTCLVANGDGWRALEPNPMETLIRRDHFPIHES